MVTGTATFCELPRFCMLEASRKLQVTIISGLCLMMYNPRLKMATGNAGIAVTKQMESNDVAL